MAQKQIVEYLCDVERAQGKTVEADITDFRFAIDGREYEIDLSAPHHRRLCDAMAPFMAAARKSGGGRTARRGGHLSTSSAAERERTRTIRGWAAEQGIECSDRGRIPAHVLEAWDNRHKPTGPRPAPQVPEPRTGNGQAPDPFDQPAAPAAPEPEAPAAPAPDETSQAPTPKRRKKEEPHAGPGPTFATKAEMNKAIRAWAAERGVEVPARGKIANEVMMVYVFEHGEPTFEAA